jgi:hypothetical protein
MGISVNLPRIETPPGEEVHDVHAARIIEKMIRYIEETSAILAAGAGKPPVNDANPKGQARVFKWFKDKLGFALLEARLTPGKRGRYTMEMTCWRASRVEKPWVTLVLTELVAKPGYRNHLKSYMILDITFHALQRLAQRSGVREPMDLLVRLSAVYRGVAEGLDKLLEEEKDPPWEGWRVPFDGGIAVVGRNPDRKGLLTVVTVLEP